MSHSNQIPPPDCPRPAHCRSKFQRSTDHIVCVGQGLGLEMIACTKYVCTEYYSVE